MLKLPYLIATVIAQIAIALIQQRGRKETRHIYRVEDPETGKTIGVFSAMGKAERLGEPIEDVLDPKLVTVYVVAIDPMGQLCQKKAKAYRLPPNDGWVLSGFDIDGPVESVGFSRRSMAEAERSAREGYDEMKSLLSAKRPGIFAYGRLYDGRLGFAFLTSGVSMARYFRNASAAGSNVSFEDARQRYGA